MSKKKVVGTPKVQKDSKKEDTKKETKVKEEPKPKKAKPKSKTRKKAIEIDLNDMIRVRSVTKGKLIYISPKTGMQFTWEDYGAEEYIEFGELLTMKASRSEFLTRPLMVVDDEEVAEKLGLTNLYKDIAKIEDVDTFFDGSLKDMQDILDVVPKGIKTLVADEATARIKNDTLFDIRKIKMLEEALNIDLQMIMD